MSNKYESIVRTYTVRNLYEDTLAPGTDVVIPASTLNRTVIQLVSDMSPETNFLVRRIGIFSNFADGLVFKNPSDRIELGMRYAAYEYSQTTLPFVLAFTQGSKAVTTVGGVPNWIAGIDYPIAVEVPATETGSSAIIIINIVATGVNTGDLEDYWMYDTNNLNTQNLAAVAPLAGDGCVMKGISVLNCMYEVNEFAQPFQFSLANAYDLVSMELRVNAIGTGAYTTTLLTNIIDASFAGEKVVFDAVVEVEFTKV